MPFVAVIIVNWNGKKFLKTCLDSLIAQDYPPDKVNILLVDNGSRDDSIVIVRKYYPKVKIIQNKKNLGFAQANNIGINFSFDNPEVKYILTLNNDTFMEKGYLSELVSFLESKPRAGACVGKILMLDDKRVIDSAGDYIYKDKMEIMNRGKFEFDVGQYDKTEKAFSVCAAGALYRRELLKEVKLLGEYFDNDFFSYKEDVDLSLRAHLMGWGIYYVPKAVMMHKGSGTSNKLSLEYKEYISRRNRILMAVKNLPIGLMVKALIKYVFPLKIVWIYELPKRVLIKIYGNKENRHKPAVENSVIPRGKLSLVHIKACLSSLRLLPRALKKRKIIREKRKITNKLFVSIFEEFSLIKKV